MSLTDLVDLVVCGDDPESISKPDPHNARYSLYATSSRAMCACIWDFMLKANSLEYSGRQLYQYNESNFRFQFWFISSLYTHKHLREAVI